MRFVKRYPSRRPMMRGMGAVDYNTPGYDPEAEGIKSLVASGDMTVEQAAQAGVTINPSVAATNSWDTASSAISNMIKSATQGYTLYKTVSTGKPAPTPAPALTQSNTSKLLLYGGIGVALIAVVMAMRNR
jgi:hypothetical protein